MKSGQTQKLTFFLFESTESIVSNPSRCLLVYISVLHAGIWFCERGMVEERHEANKGHTNENKTLASPQLSHLLSATFEIPSAPRSGPHHSLLLYFPYQHTVLHLFIICSGWILRLSTQRDSLNFEASRKLRRPSSSQMCRDRYLGTFLLRPQATNAK